MTSLKTEKLLVGNQDIANSINDDSRDIIKSVVGHKVPIGEGKLIEKMLENGRENIGTSPLQPLCHLEVPLANDEFVFAR